MSDTRITARIGVEALERLDGLAAERGLSRSGALRALLEGPVRARVLADREEALTLLSESARDGSVPARIALARLLAGPSTGRAPVQRRRDELKARREAKGA